MMKSLLLYSLFLLSGISTISAQGYKVTLQTPNYKSGIAYLTYHRGKNLNIEDSAAVNNQGVAVFKGAKHLPPGIYSMFSRVKR